MQLAHKWLLFSGLLMGFLSVVLGAFAAHALKKTLGAERLAIFEVGARYQMYHAFAICLAVWIATLIPGTLPPLAGWLFFAGTLIFSGSLYLLALTDIRILGAFTPIGGALFLTGWLLLAIGVVKS
jgi:uncharacterized membrane protein YgdD (TMEM256/DUF423 family)